MGRGYVRHRIELSLQCLGFKAVLGAGSEWATVMASVDVGGSVVRIRVSRWMRIAPSGSQDKAWRRKKGVSLLLSHRPNTELRSKHCPDVPQVPL